MARPEEGGMSVERVTKKDADGLIYLRKTARPKWNCCMKEFRPENVYPSYVAAMRAIKEAQP